MRTLCVTDATSWEPTPPQDTLAGIPHTILKKIIKDVFEVKVAPKLKHHCCDTTAPCVVLREAMQTCVRLLLVCKAWSCFVSAVMKDSQARELLAPPDKFKSRRYYSYNIAFNVSLGGRYRAYKCIEQENSELHLARRDGYFRAYCVSQIRACCEAMITAFQKAA